MTDSLDNRDHVWVTVKRVTLNGASGGTTVFDDPVGKTIDLKSLRDASGERYSFLAGAPGGIYSGLTVTVDKTLTLFSGGQSSGQVREFQGNNGSTATLSLTFAAPRNIGRSNGLAIDFNLGSWDDNGSTVTGAPFLKEGLGSGIDDLGRQEHEDFKGAIQGLSATGFNLVSGSHSVAVVVTPSTTIFNSNGAPSPQLANGERVEVQGLFSNQQNALVADSIKIKSADDSFDGPEVQGSIASIGADSFVLQIDEAHDFTPTSTTVAVATNPTTVFVSHGGMTMTQAEFFAAIANGMQVEAEGSYDAATDTLNAQKVKLEDGEDNSELKGSASAINAGSGTFDVSVQQWEGLNLSPGQLVHIATNASTDFGSMTGQQFFAALTNGAPVEVEGSFDAATSTLTASKAKLDD